MITANGLSEAMQVYGVVGRPCDDRVECRWIPLLKLHADGHDLGISSAGHWVGDSASGLIDFVAQDWYAPLLPLMERTLPDFTDELERALRAKGLSTELACTFPFHELIRLGLRQSSYWVERALSWLEDLPITDEFVPLLRAVREDKGRVQQATRQHAERLLRRAEKGAQGGLVGVVPDDRKP